MDISEKLKLKNLLKGWNKQGAILDTLGNTNVSSRCSLSASSFDQL